MFILYNNDTEKFETFTESQLFEMLNRDRSEDWIAYHNSDTLKTIKEGINEFCAPYSVEEDMPFKQEDKL